MEFNIGSFIIGMLAGLVAAIVLPVRERIMAGLAFGRGKVMDARKALTRSADANYRLDLTKDCQTMHIAGDFLNLTDIIVEPRFLPASELADPAGAEAGSVMRVVPLHHDMPYSYAPFNLETVAFDDLRGGGARLAILGTMGAGKTTALSAVALTALGELDFDIIAALSEEMEEAPEAEEDLSEEEREDAERTKERQKEIEQRAIEHLRSLQLAEDFEEELYGGPQRIDWADYTPMFFHLADIELGGDAWGDKVDPAEPLVRALMRRVGQITKNTIPRFVYKQVADGNTLLLIDGYDELPAAMREEKLAWLRQFMEMYPDNLYYIAGPAEAYGPLVELGFVPVFLRPWMDQDNNRLAESWAAAWPRDEKKKGDEEEVGAFAFDERTIGRAMADSRSRSPLDMTLKVWMAYASDGREVGRVAWYDAYVHRYFDMDEEEHAEKGRQFLEMMAARTLDGNGYSLHRDDVKEALTRLFTLTETVTVKTKEGEEEQVKEKVEINVDRFIRNLTGKFRLMVSRPGDILSFRHPLLGSYLAAEAIVKDPAHDPSALLDKPAWCASFPFMAAKANLDHAVVTHLSTQPDLLYSHLFEVASWLIDAPSSARWRGEVFKRLARALMAPNQFQVVRERALAAIIMSRDENVLFVYRQALRSTDPGIRQLACLGMGALGKSEAIKDLMPMLADDTLEVQLAAGLALGAIGTERAMEVMVQGLLEGEEDLRRAVAEALASITGDGHAILRDAIDHSEMMIRRAAVFGLRRIKATWALVLLYRALMEDEQWYVRSAAQEAFAEARNPEIDALKGYPPLDSVGWLVNWAAERGGGVPEGEAAFQVLVRALQDGEPPIRAAAAVALGLLGHVPALKPLYLALRDDEAGVRDDVFRALATLQASMGEALPTVA